MEDMMGRAYAETYDIINHMEKSIYQKIPKSLLKFISDNRDLNYKVNIDYTKSINEQNLMKETRALLAVIYKDYLCSLEKKQELILKDKEELIRLEELKKEKYNPNNIFKNPEIESEKDTEENNSRGMIEYKESIFQKLINKLKSIFIK